MEMEVAIMFPLNRRFRRLLLDFVISLTSVTVAAAIGFYLGRNTTLVQLEQTVEGLRRQYDGAITNDQQALYQAQVAKALWGRVQAYTQGKAKAEAADKASSNHKVEAEAERAAASGSAVEVKSEREN